MNIKEESYLFSNIVSDLDNLRSRYLEHDWDTRELSVVFPSGEIFSIENNKFRLLNNSKKIKFESRWSMRPDYVSFEFYDTVIYWHIILFINNILCIEEFKDLEYIYIPDYDDIMEVIRDRIPEDEIQPLEIFVVDESVKYLKKSPLDDLELKQIESRQRINNFDDFVDSRTITSTKKISEIEEEFVVDSQILSNKKISLTNIPINISSISFYIDDFILSQRYGYDYILTDNNEICWDPEYLYSNDGGIDEIISLDTRLVVKYIYEYFEEV